VVRASEPRAVTEGATSSSKRHPGRTARTDAPRCRRREAEHDGHGAADETTLDGREDPPSSSPSVWTRASSRPPESGRRTRRAARGGELPLGPQIRGRSPHGHRARDRRGEGARGLWLPEPRQQRGESVKTARASTGPGPMSVQPVCASISMRSEPGGSSGGRRAPPASRAGGDGPARVAKPRDLLAQTGNVRGDGSQRDREVPIEAQPQLDGDAFDREILGQAVDASARDAQAIDHERRRLALAPGGRHARRDPRQQVELPIVRGQVHGGPGDVHSRMCSLPSSRARRRAHGQAAHGHHRTTRRIEELDALQADARRRELARSGRCEATPSPSRRPGP